jgi:hypothetical protein
MKKCMQVALVVILFWGCQTEEEFPYPSIFWGFALEGFPITHQQLEFLYKQTQIRPELILFYLQWPAPGAQQEPLTPSLAAIWSAEAVPCLTWEPMYKVDQVQTTIPYEDILDGQYDAYLFEIAKEIKEWGKPLVIRFAHEMNLSSYHWGTSLSEYGPLSPVIYKKMVHYIVELFRRTGAANVLWAFCPNADSIPDTAWNTARAYYPGDAYVDLLGMDGYNWKNGSEARSFEEIFERLYRQLKEIAPHKPLIVFETASGEQETQKEWIRDTLQISKKWGIKGIVWFQANKEEDWRLKTHADASDPLLVNPAQPSLQQWLLNRQTTQKVKAIIPWILSTPPQFGCN